MTEIEAVSPRSLPDPVFYAVDLMARSKVHRSWTVVDLRRLVLPPIQKLQCLFFKKNTQVIGFVTWALLSDEMANHLRNRSHPLSEHDWSAGKNLWIIDFVGLDGDVIRISSLITAHLKSLYYPGIQEAFAVRQYADGRSRKVIKFSDFTYTKN